MAIADPTVVARASKLFPELSLLELEISLLFCGGCDRHDLVEEKEMSLSRIDAIFRSIRGKLHLKNNDLIRVAVNVRTSLHLLKF